MFVPIVKFAENQTIEMPDNSSIDRERLNEQNYFKALVRLFLCDNLAGNYPLSE